MSVMVSIARIGGRNRCGIGAGIGATRIFKRNLVSAGTGAGLGARHIFLGLPPEQEPHES